MQFLDSLKPLSGRYSGILLDLWGCLHDGSHLYPGAHECLVKLRAQGMKIIMLSNAPRRTEKALIVLDRLGVGRALYDGALTSGEAGYMALKDGHLSYGPRYFYIGPGKDADVLGGLRYTPTPRIAAADFILNVGFGSEEHSMDEWDGVLSDAAARKLPMLCLNPDMEVVKITGERFPCAGVIARAYERLGCTVTYFGKPYPEVYAQALAMMGLSGDKVLAIGDGLHTDVLGAKQAGCASALVTGGILKQELGNISREALRAHLAKQDVQADYVLPGLVW